MRRRRSQFELEAAMQREAEQNREWEQWPGRTPPEERVRGRLKALFAPSDEGDMVAELIAVRGRELEQRSAELRTMVGELEQRESRARALHLRVEQILRDGAAELDLRQAELTVRASELDRREASVAERETAVEARRRELGAVELRRAAVERREDAAGLREEELERRAGELATLARRLDELGGVLGEMRTRPPLREDEYVALLAGDRYRLVDVPGAPPASGAMVDVEGDRYVCIRATTSPLPGDDRRCALLERVLRDEPSTDGWTS
jgi:uncharacterized protein (DUF3084 family)